MRQFLRMPERILLVSEEGLAQPLLDLGIERLNVPVGPLRVNEAVSHRLKTCAWVLTLMAL